MSYSQGDTYYATRLEVATFVTSMSLLIMRQSDGLFLDWADTTFKATPGTPTRALTEVTPPGETKSFWRDATGYVLPSVDAGYLPLFKDSDGGLQQGERIEVKTVASSGLTQQQVRDAMKLAPTAGAPTAGSVDDHLDIINTDTTTDIPATIAALNDFNPAADTVVNVATTAAIGVAERSAIADALLDRDMATGTDTGSNSKRTVRQALRMNRNKVAISGGTLTVSKEDDVAASHTAVVTTAAGDPIVGVDPA